MVEKKLIYYILAITLLGVGLISYFVSYPLVKKIDESKKEVQSKQSELKALEKKEEELKELELNYRNFQDKIDLLAGLFPKAKNVSDYITQVENAASGSGVFIKTIKISGQTKDNKEVDPKLTQLSKIGDFYELPVDITTEPGSYENFVNFTLKMEILSRFTSIKKSSLRVDTNGIMEGTTNLVIYVLP